jgi:hypothetical protein
MGIRFCPKHKHFNGLSIIKVATRMWYTTLALDKGYDIGPLQWTTKNIEPRMEGKSAQFT